MKPKKKKNPILQILKIKIAFRSITKLLVFISGIGPQSFIIDD